MIPMYTYCFDRGPRFYLYAKCLPCGQKQKMKYIRLNAAGEKFRLVYFDNTHNHSQQSQRKKSAANNREIYSEMQRTPRDMLIDEFKDMIRTKYNISDSSFYYMLSRFRKNNENFRSMVAHLRKNGCLVWLDIDDIAREAVEDQPLEEDPRFFMIAFKPMVENYLRYGDCTYLMVIRDLIRKRTVMESKDWDIIALNGLTYNNKFAPFALGFLQVDRHTAFDITRIVANLFRRAAKTPRTLITPDQPLELSVVAGLRREGSFAGLHMLDGIEELEEMQKNMQDANQFKFFQEMVHSTCRAEYYCNAQRLFRHLLPTLETRKQFNSINRRAPQLCFGFVETDHFLGMGYRYSGNRYMSIMIKYIFVHSSLSSKSTVIRPKELYLSIKLLTKEYLKLMEPEIPYIRYHTWKFEHYFGIPEMELVRNSMKSSVLDIFLAEFNKTFQVDARERALKDHRRPEMRVFDIFDKFSQALFVVAARPEYDEQKLLTKFVWRCNCLYSLKCGMPCAHEIKAVLMTGSSMLDQVHPRWVVPKLGRKKAPGRPKVSRRNTMK